MPVCLVATWSEMSPVMSSLSMFFFIFVGLRGANAAFISIHKAPDTFAVEGKPHNITCNYNLDDDETIQSVTMWRGPQWVKLVQGTEELGKYTASFLESQFVPNADKEWLKVRADVIGSAVRQELGVAYRSIAKGDSLFYYCELEYIPTTGLPSKTVRTSYLPFWTKYNNDP